MYIGIENSSFTNFFPFKKALYILIELSKQD